MNRNKLLKLSLYSFLIALVVFVINYFVFHFVTDERITLTWHEEAGKPFITNLVGMFGILWIFAGSFCLLLAFVCFQKSKDK